MLLGEYTFEGDMNLMPFFELGYVEDDYSNFGDEGNFFPDVPARNPYNLCNPEGFGHRLRLGLRCPANAIRTMLTQFADFYTEG